MDRFLGIPVHELDTQFRTCRTKVTKNGSEDAKEVLSVADERHLTFATGRLSLSEYRKKPRRFDRLPHDALFFSPALHRFSAYSRADFRPS